VLVTLTEDRLQDCRRAVAILDAGAVDDEADHQPGGPTISPVVSVTMWRLRPLMRISLIVSSHFRRS